MLWTIALDGGKFIIFSSLYYHSTIMWSAVVDEVIQQSIKLSRQFLRTWKKISFATFSRHVKGKKNENKKIRC